MIKNKKTKLAILFTLATALSHNAFALTANEDQLLVKTSESKREGETAFSVYVAWRKGSDNLHRANGLVFINGIQTKNPTSAEDVARKAAKAFNASLDYDAPSERGAEGIHEKGEAKFLMTNKEGFDFSELTIRDYSNQKLEFSIPSTSFAAADVDVSIDFVYSAAVEYIEGFFKKGQDKAAGGVITVTIDDEVIEIKTDNKTTKDIEKELAAALASKGRFSTEPLYRNYIESGARNYKPFDGGEVRLASLSAESITIDINDPAIGVLAKFKYPDANKPADIANRVPYVVAFIVVTVVGFVGYKLKTEKTEEETLNT